MKSLQRGLADELAEEGDMEGAAMERARNKLISQVHNPLPLLLCHVHEGNLISNIIIGSKTDCTCAFVSAVWQYTYCTYVHVHMYSTCTCVHVCTYVHTCMYVHVYL